MPVVTSAGSGIGLGIDLAPTLPTRPGDSRFSLIALRRFLSPGFLDAWLAGRRQGFEIG